MPDVPALMLSLSQSLDAQLRAAMQRAFPEADAGLDPQLAPASKPEFGDFQANGALPLACLLYTSPSPRDATLSRMPSSA